MRYGPCLLVLLAFALPARAEEKAKPWLLGKAYKLPSELTNQESGYFSIIEGLNGRLYIGAAKYGVNAYLIEFDPKAGTSKAVMDVHQIVGSNATGFAAQAKIHTRNNLGESGKIYVGSKQGYPENGETRDQYLGGYVLTYDPATAKSEHFGIAKAKHGIISVTPDESRGVAYISTCSDDRPIDHTHFMVLDLKTKTYTDLGDMEVAYAFIAVDHAHRALHPKRGGSIVRYDPATKKLETLKITVDGAAPPEALTRDHAILNWDWSPDHKTLWCVELFTNQVYSFDLTATGDTLPGKTHGPMLAHAKATDCRAMCVSPADGVVWMAVTEQQRPGGALLHLVSYRPGAAAPVNHGPVGLANPDYTSLVDAEGKPKPWHHTLRKEPDGTLTPWQPLGICTGRDGTVNIVTIAPFTLLRIDASKLK